MDTYLLDANNYKIKTWTEKFPDYNVKLGKLKINSSWSDFFDNDNKDVNDKIYEKIKDIDDYFSHCLNVTNGDLNIYPYPDLIFNALNTTPLNDIKVVILGQDPYHGFEYKNNTKIPQAMGLSFSVPKGIKIPSSLNNIYDNLLKFGHITKKPIHGNLSFWAYQGCLLLNTSLTVQESNPNCHEEYWKFITDELIKFISNQTENIVFVLWGAPALKKLSLIDQQKHKVIISSHPSGLSYTKPLGKYKSFSEVDHFGEINKYLTEHDKKSILWQII